VVSTNVEGGIKHDPKVKLEDTSDADSLSMSESSGESSVISDFSSNSDGPPEVSSSKAQQPTKVDLSNQHNSTKNAKPLCRYVVRHGFCKFRNKCRFTHPPLTENEKKAGATRGKNAKKSPWKSLNQKLIEQELKQEAAVGVDVIKHLAKAGFFEQAI